MSRIKSRLPEYIESGLDMALDENGNYPGEVEYEIEQAHKQWVLSQYSIQDLYDEITRRTFEPYLKSLKELSLKIDSHINNNPF